MGDWVSFFADADRTVEILPLGPNTWQMRWSDPIPEGLSAALSDWAEQTPTGRLVHLGRAGDYNSLRQARSLGFQAEGTERRWGPDGIEVFWRSSRLAGSVSVNPADSIDGARPSHLVDEFHAVYDLPSNVTADFEPSVDFDRLGLRMSLIKEEFAELCGAVYGPDAEQMLLEVYETLPDTELRDSVETADALADLVYVIYGMALEAGIDLDRVLAEVHRSNLSKLMPDGSVKRRDDGKVLKGPDFSPPNIAEAMRAK